ncbi:ABC transporter ATP-binding protein [bacterium AH-315-J19]|nr:ABC transporter ATP-binding protein [Robiginitomaculum sp.]MBN4058509.1 ABC transporter ATP-binding protein [bacterium AH-315-J19]
MPALEGHVIHTTNLTKKYGKNTALNNVNIEVGNSGITAILGENGAGKTTFIHACLGLIKATHGQISMFGLPPGKLTSRRRTGVMLQDADLPDLLTPREHITLFASYYPAPLSLDDVLDMCKLTTLADKKYGKLSGGQKRRVQFALAIIGNPDLVFLDEPTTGLDTDTRRMLWDVVRKLAEDGRTVILTTHYLEEADALADRIIVMNAGEIIADAPTPEIRALAGGAIIKCVTNLSVKAIHKLPDVKSVRKTGRFVEISTQNQASTLQGLLAADINASELVVKKPSLEEAFDQIIHNQEQA